VTSLASDAASGERGICSHLFFEILDVGPGSKVLNYEFDAKGLTTPMLVQRYEVINPHYVALLFPF
jgi:hypothetical protein